MSPYDEIRQESLGWIREAGAIAARRFGKATTSWKQDDSPVTDADHAVQESLLSAIAARYPGDAVLSEETQVSPGRHAELSGAGRCWVIDPIDGTRNYARAVPTYSISVALMENGRPVVGVIHDPSNGYSYSASAGGGMWLNDQRVPRGEPPPFKDVLIASPSGQRHALPCVTRQWLNRYKLRNIGSTALHLAYMAAGGYDAVLLTECHLWDVAAGLLLGQEVGAEVRTLDGTSLFPINLLRDGHREISLLTARPRILERLWSELQAARNDG